jgi:hypothetical protein
MVPPERRLIDPPPALPVREGAVTFAMRITVDKKVNKKKTTLFIFQSFNL